MELIFQILCGCLYVVGLPFGWNYQETSIYICIYLWPILCTLFTLMVLWQSVKLIKRDQLLGIAFTFFSLIHTGYYAYITTECIKRYNINDPAAFMNCMIDLESLAASIGVTYATINILIYVVLFLFIFLYNWGVARLIKLIKRVKLDTGDAAEASILK